MRRITYRRLFSIDRWIGSYGLEGWQPEVLPLKDGFA